MAINRTSDQFLLDAYNGSGGFATGDYLIAHPRESIGKFTRRKELAVYPNFSRKIVDIFAGFLWRRSPAREVDELYAKFCINADGQGAKIDALLFAYQRLAMILGTVYIIVDKPRTQGETAADQAMPYLAMRLPRQLVNEIKNADGTWESVTFSESSAGQTITRTFTKTGWSVSNTMGDSTTEKSGTYNLGRVPVVKLHIAKPVNPVDSQSRSWFYDLAALNWDLFNLRSELRELFRAQTFAILALPVVDDKERERLTDMTISTENGLPYNPAGGGKPEYIAPPSDPVDLYMKMIAETVQDIYRVANLEFVGGVQQSGVALGFHFQEANSSLRGMAETCEAAEMEIAQLVYQWQGQKFEGNIAYANDFNLTDLAQEISVAMDSVTLNMGPEFDKTIKKRLAKQILGNDTAPSTMTAIDAEIDAQGDTYSNRLAQQAGA